MSEKLAQRVIAVITKSQKIPAEKVGIDSTFEELGIDSLDGMTLVFALEEEFNISIPDEAAQGMRTVRQAVEALDRALAGGQTEAGAVAQS